MLSTSKRFEKGLQLFIFLLIIAAVLFAGFAFISIRTNVNVITIAVDALKSLLADSHVSTIERGVRTVYQISIIEIIILAAGVLASLFAVNYLINIYFDASRHSLVDELTGVYNRRALYKILDQEIKRAERFKHPLSISMVDVDHFKKYNDANGHLAGDLLLQRMSEIVKKQIRDVDTFGRYGGEEFLIILPETPHEEASKVCERIRQAVESTHFPGEKTQPLKHVTISMGLVTFHGEYKTRAHMINSADELLYQAKEAGRNRLIKAYYKELDEEESTIKSE
ncbi:MAG: GGDEF domain-containing protein [archaeon]|jgi:diguanylate cyclase (GGDEF)-like protein|nr:GGDEF domain-containing protein [archaeon]